jgi:hypothetical protein
MPSHGEIVEPHDEKNVWADLYEKSGRDLLKTPRAMGHKSPANTVTYLHIDERDIDALILAL